MATHKIVYNFGFLSLFFFVPVTTSLNLGLISGDLKRSSSPLIIKKMSHLSPITINIRQDVIKPQKLIPPALPPTLSLKTSPIKTKIKKPIKPLTHLPKLSKLPKIPKFPKLPKLPVFPLIPPLLPPIIPKLSLLPLPILPILPPPLPPIVSRLTKLKKPISVPILGKSKLQKALGSELKPLILSSSKSKINKNILDKLLKLKKDGSLTTAQFMRFKKMLL